MLRSLTSALISILVTATAAQAAEYDATCRNGLFPADPPFALAEVRGEERAYFRGDMNGCPWTRGACSSPSYVVSGDTVIISRIRKGYACAFYPGKGGGTAGWVPTRQLSLLFVDTHPNIESWTGAWSSLGNPAINIRQEFGRLRVSGEAFWPGRPESTDWPSIHVGEIAGSISVAGQRGDYRDDNDCKIRFTLLNDYLIAGDNRQCGGANVSFSGVYRREAN